MKSWYSQFELKNKLKDPWFYNLAYINPAVGHMRPLTVRQLGRGPSADFP